MSEQKRIKKAISAEGVVCILVFSVFCYFLGSRMGIINMFNTLMKTAHDLILNTVFFIMGIAVLAGAIASIFSEFGVISIINKLLSPLMKPLYGLPGAAILGVVTTYLSDNPAIITLAKDKGFKKYFKKYQLPALTNIGTAFGMGLIVTTFMVTQKSPTGESFLVPTLIGNVGAIIGSIVSVKIMIMFTKKVYGTEAGVCDEELGITSCDKSLLKDRTLSEVEVDNDSKSEKGKEYDLINYREIRDGSVGKRALEAMLEGGKSGVQMGMEIIPGVVIICTLVLMLTNGTSVSGVYTGGAYEGVPFLPWLGDKLSFIIKPLFGFQSSEAIAFPFTALGAVGAAIGLVPKLLQQGAIGGNEIAVFTAMGMCWSGYLSTHVAMMDSLDCRELTGKAILSHTIGGLCAGISAHVIYMIMF